jgi:type I restriction enzyme M protein
VQDPAKLKRLVVDLIGQENWSATGTDIKGDAYEELLSKGAEDIKSGAGQYFTPRALIRAMVDCVQPTVRDTVVDPATGTGGFLLVAHEYAAQHAETLTPNERTHLRDTFVHGVELVDGTARLAAMNLLLHGIGTPTGESLIEVKDALIADPGDRYSVVLSNPPFGRKSSLTMVGADGREAREDREIERQDFVVTTANKQLNFLQHIATILDINGRAAVVLPDNVLFEGGAGETLRRRILRDFDVHTMLRLPTGIFYAQGVKANVLFFDKRPASERPWTERLWIYDLRTNQHFTLKQNPLRRHHLDDFVACYLPGKPRTERVENERFRSFTYDELIARDKVNLDITWLRDESLEDMDNLPAPEVIAREIVEDLTAALAEFEAVATALETPNAHG